MALLQNKLDMDAEEEQRGQKRKISLSSCDVCEVQEAKYCCPGCLKCSCSLSCVKQHKLQSGCSGVRDRTAFVPLSRFGDLHMLSDYRFLEETGRVAERPNRDTMLHTRARHSYGAMLLLRNAKAAKVNLKILPKSFSRRRENTSIYNKQERKLYWQLKLVFPQSSAEYTTRVPEDRVLEKILSDYIHPTESDPVKRQNLKTYVVSPLDQIGVFMKAEQRKPNSLNRNVRSANNKALSCLFIFNRRRFLFSLYFNVPMTTLAPPLRLGITIRTISSAPRGSK
ncbi:hypothetical protein Q7C36_018786 [Tachysurus vachellii]|uniref:HIT-type domain-containing protein n=1 Tax=Tachysurus vachellii TaxID=175792 RepID=A0AA88LVA3_TACVA|nr:hypothetical protein Q7C36_018786 [Tachysurus vachellii]